MILSRNAVMERPLLAQSGRSRKQNAREANIKAHATAVVHELNVCREQFV